MSNPVGAQRYGLGGGDAYYDAVKYGGYTGTREQFGRDQAEFAQNATAVAQAKEEVERNTQTVVNTAQMFTEETVPAAIQSVEEKGDTEEDRLEARTTELVEAVNTAGAVQVQAVRDEGTTQTGLVSGAGTAQVEAIEQAGSDQVDAVELAGSTQVGNVNSAGTTQVGNVNQAGTIQVGNVNTAGAAQVQTVEDKGEEVLNSIPSDYTELTEDVDNLKTALHDVAVSTYKIKVTKGATANASGALVPFVAKNGDSITAYTVDDSTFGEVQLRFYSKDKTYIKHWTLASGYGKTRTFTFDQPTEAYYVGVTTINTSSPSDYYVINNSNIYKQENDNLQNQVATVQTNIDLLEGRAAIKSIINRFNKSTITVGKYINITNGTLANSNDFFASDFIYIGDLAKVTVSYTHLFCWYDANKAYLTPNPSPMNSRTNDLTFDVPENAKYLRFSTYNADLNLSQIGNVSRANYVPYGKYTLPDYVPSSNEIIVDVGGSGDYTSLTEALYENVDSGETIRVMSGTYDIHAEYIAKWGASAVDAMADSDSATFNGFQFGAIIRNRKVIFEAGSFVVCDFTYQSDGTTAQTIDGTHRMCALRMDYNAEVYGLNLTATHTFYAIHDDYGVSAPFTNIYENCYIKAINCINANCIGGGCKKFSKHILRNCYFDNSGLDSATVRYHNTNDAGAVPEIYVYNCFFTNELSFRWYGTQTSKMKAYVNNCHAKTILKQAESSSYNVDNVELYKWCNEETNPQT